jgi:hypothetical protein
MIVMQEDISLVKWWGAHVVLPVTGAILTGVVCLVFGVKL